VEREGERKREGEGGGRREERDLKMTYREA
jgi:hypothetical protein